MQEQYSHRYPGPTPVKTRFFDRTVLIFVDAYSFVHNVAFSRGAGWRGLCFAQTVTDRTVGYNAWLAKYLVDRNSTHDRKQTGDGK